MKTQFWTGIFLLFVSSSTPVFACSEYLESGDPGESDRDWNDAFEKMDREQDAKAAWNKRVEAILEIEGVRRSAAVGRPRKQVTPEALVKTEIESRLGFTFDKSLPQHLVGLARNILAIRLTGQENEREITKAMKRLELKERLEREVEAFVRTTDAYKEIFELWADDVQEMSDHLKNLDAAIQTASKDRTSQSYASLGELLAKFQDHCTELASTGSVNVSAFLARADLRRSLSQLLSPNLPAAVVFMIRGTLAEAVVSLQQIADVPLPQNVILPFARLDATGKIWEGLREFEAFEDTGEGDGAAALAHTTLGSATMKAVIEAVLAGG